MNRYGTIAAIIAADDILNRRIISALQDWNLLPRDGKRTAGAILWQAVFFMGVAGAGKSFVRTKRYMTHFDFKAVDPDDILRRHPDYDPMNPQVLHDWSKEVADGEFASIIRSGTGQSVVVDGTGTNPENTERKVEEAQAQGYRTYLVYVWVPLEVSLFRNRSRDRFVPESVVLRQNSVMQQSFGYLRNKVDQFKVIPNYEEPELKLAKDDMAMYPPPQKVRPPRPGDPMYGVIERAASCRR
jgi:predicted ABC-type ATPase